MITGVQRTILLVEDDAVIAMSGKKNLEKYGYKVITASSGKEAVKTADEAPDIELILMDIDLGKGMDGTEAAGIILRKHDIPVVFLSSHSEPEVVDKTEKISSYGYVVKNSGITILDASIKMAFRLFNANKKIIESEYFFKESQRAANIGSYKTDFTKGTWESSEVLDHIFGISHSYDRSIQGWLDIVHPEDREMMDVYLREEVIGNRKAFNREYRITRKTDGEIRWVNGLGQVAFGKTGNIASLIGTIQDITERKLAENRLTAIMKAVEATSDAVGISDAQGRHFFQNRALSDLFGYESAEELQAAGGGPIVVKDHGVAREMFENIMSGKSWSGELEMVKKNGQVFPAYERADAIMDSGGNIIGLIGIITDITGRKRAENEIRRQNEELEAANEELNAAMEEMEATNEELMASNEELIRSQDDIIAGEKALRESEFKYRSLIESSSDVVFCVDRNGVYQFVNNAFASAFNKAPEYFTGKTYWDIYPKEHADFRQAATGRVFETGAGDSVEVIVPLADKTLTFLAKLNPMKDEEGKVGLVLVNSIDITDRKRLEEELQKSESTFRSIFEKSSIGYVLTSPEGRMLKVNSAMAHMLGYSIDEMELVNFRDITHPDDIYVSNESLQSLLSGECDIIQFDKRYIHKNGSLVWTLVNTTLVRDNRGLPLYFITGITDITERKRVDEELKESESKYRLLFENMGEGFSLHEIIFDTNGRAVDFRFIDANAAHERHTGLKRSETVGRTMLEIIPNADPQQIEQYGHVVQTGEPLSFEYYSKTFNRHLRVLAFRHSSRRFATIFQDITERKKADEKINALLAEKELILKEVHHRIRNNMSTLKSLLELQAEAKKEPSAAAAITDAANRMQSMMALYDKLYLSPNYNELSVKEYIPTLVQQIMENFPDSNSVKIEKNIDDFILDSKRLSTLGILINELLTNIMKYAFKKKAGGVITISIRLKGNCVSVTIQDNGIGMPETIDVGHSPGFGLTLVGLLAKQLDGTITIERIQGTRIVLEFRK